MDCETGTQPTARIVEAHHGRVWFESQPEGTEFSMVLPAAEKRAFVYEVLTASLLLPHASGINLRAVQQ
jgi:hypothetical protein